MPCLHRANVQATFAEIEVGLTLGIPLSDLYLIVLTPLMSTPRTSLHLCLSCLVQRDTHCFFLIHNARALTPSLASRTQVLTT
jgi:hypothetical protein